MREASCKYSVFVSPVVSGFVFFLCALDWVDVMLRAMSADVAWTLGFRLWRTLTEQQGAFVTSVRKVARDVKTQSRYQDAREVWL